MSAFLCTPEHIAVIANCAASRGIADTLTAQEIAEGFARSNLASVAHRYEESPDQTAASFMGCTSAEEYVRLCIAETFGGETAAPLSVFKLAACLEYQSCEHPEWEKSDAAQWIAELQAAVCKQLNVTPDRARGLQAYDALPWSYERPVQA